MYRKLASALLVASALSAKYADAVSLGELTMKSALNEPLQAEIRLTDAGDLDTSQILINFADIEAFTDAGLERTFYHSNIKFEISLDGEGNGIISLTSDKRLNEPFIDLLIEAKWPTGRMLRAYTALVDLPVYSETDAAAVDTGTRPASVTATQAAAEERQQQQAQLAEEQAAASRAAARDSASTEQPSSKPAAATQRPRNPAAMVPLADNEYRTERNDTLWAIAEKLTGDDVSINQAMVAIQRTNPDAFMGNNINRLKAGVVLRLPSRQAIREISAQAATQQVAAQTREWKGAQLDTDSTAGQSAGGRPAAAGDGHLRLTSAGASSAAGQDDEGRAELQQQLNQAQDELAAARRDKQDLGTRVESLSSQVDQLKRMVELKDAELASLQNQLGQKGEQPADDKKLADKPEQKTPEQPVEEEKAEAKPDEVAAVADKPAKKAATPKPEKEAARPKPAAEKKQPQPGLVDKILANPIYIGIPAILIIAGVVGFLLRRRTQQERQLLEENDSFAFDDDQDLAPPSFDDDLYDSGAAGAQDELDSAAYDESPSATDAGEDDQTLMAEAPAEQEEETTTVQTGDAISEAEIYIAYNRYDQAIELLKNAIAASPKDVALHSKLLEVCIESGDKESFRDVFPQLQALGDENAITHVKDLLSNADAADWLDDLPDTGAAPASDLIAEAASAGQAEQAEEELSLDSDLDFDSLAGDEETGLDTADDGMLDLSEEFGEDLQLDGALDDVSVTEQEATDDLEAADDGLSLDDLDLGDGSGQEDDWSVADELPADESAALEDSFVSQEPESEAQDSEWNADESLDLESGTDADEALSLDEEELSLDTDDLSLDLGLDETHLDSEEEQAAQSAIGDDEEVLDFDGLELDSEVEAEAGQAPAPEEAEQTPDEISLDELSFDDLAETEESAGEQADDTDVELTREAGEDEDQETLSLSDFDLDFDDIEPEAESDEQTMVRDAISDDAAESADEAPEAAPEAAELAPEAAEDQPQMPAEDEVAEPAAVEDEAHESAPLDVLEEDDLTFLSDADEVSTKLDLAQAYIDMGDVDGARDILLEVVKEGSDEQKTDASAMLDTLE